MDAFGFRIIRFVTQRLSRLTLLQTFAVVSLVVFVFIGLGTAYVIGGAVQRSALRAAESDAIENLQKRLINHLSPVSLRGPMRGSVARHFDHLVRRDVLDGRVVVVKVWNPKGVVVYSSDRGIIGKHFPLEDDVSAALHGRPFANVSSLDAEENQSDRRFGKLLQVYIPIRFSNGPVLGAFEIYEVYGPLGGQIASLQRTSYEVLGGGLLVLYVLLFGIVRAGSDTIIRQQRQLRSHADELETSYKETITSLAAAVDARDSQTELHSERVVDLAVRLGKNMKLDEATLQSLQKGAQLHDIGKIGVPDAILLKPGPLTETEWQRMRMHPVIGYDMIKDISFLADALPVVRHHHERWDGRGYPDGLCGNEIPLVARIFSIVDTFDAITCDRPYHAGSTVDIALVRIWRESGAQFDPDIVDCFLEMMSPRSEVEAAEYRNPQLQRAA